MSSGLECAVLKYGGEWYYLLQDYSCPVGAWDWREEATGYGPFDTREGALTHLGENHSNPGGYSTTDYDAEGTDPGASTLARIAEAPENTKRLGGYRLGRWGY